MEKEKSQEELQSRRDFFIKIAKSVLPILGGIAFSSLPSNKIEASNNESDETEIEMGCDWGCTGSCKGSCGRVCSYDCTNSCAGGCDGNCKGTCYGNCKGTCGGSCRGYSY